ncbi:MAG TPA: NAD(P)H-dependent oxidoreductase [Epsilonproteobacteria bacterium]|nr:NAD(P)H-dependent oxidoreductase [Campylobacterota bacterium]
MNHEKILEILHFRHACKQFDPTKIIPKESMGTLLEVARLSPSSFGMEPWRFIVVTNPSYKNELQPLCWNQPQITSCSHLVIFVAKHHSVQDSSYYERLFARRGLAKEALTQYLKRYKSYISSLPSIQEWCEKQCYIAATNMMSFGAILKIDSCPIEGFQKEQLQEKLKLDTTKESVALVVAFGYKVQDPTQKHRLSREDIITWID